MADINLGVGGANSAVGGFDIANSLKLENDNAEQLYYTPSSAGNLKTWTYSCWFKRTELSYNMMLFGANDTYAYFETDDTLKLRFTGTYVFDTARVFRDTSAWTHIVVAVDTTQATQADRIKIYFNGEDQTGLFANDSFPAQNTNTSWNNTLVHYVAGWATASFNPSCYLAEVYNIDGQKLEATDFGEFDTDTGIWKPKAYTGTYGTNGYHLDFENASDLGTVAAGTQHSFVKSNITSADQATDTPTNNFCTLNPLLIFDAGGYAINGATTFSQDSGAGGAWQSVPSTQAVKNGKWYVEFESAGTGINRFIGVVPESSFQQSNTNYIANTGYVDSIALLRNGYIYYNDGGSTGDYNLSGLTSWGVGDDMAIALDMDNGLIYFRKNGNWGNSADPETPTGGISLFSTDAHYICVSMANDGGLMHCNFGGFTEMSIASGNTDANGYGNFEYAPPSGYYALCSKNLAEFG